MQQSFTVKLSVLVLIGLMTQSCVNLKPRENETRFFVLGTPVIEASSVMHAGGEGVVIGLRRLELAAYLDTPQIVVRIGTNEVQFSDTHRWGEDLAQSINRVVADLIKDNAAIQYVDIVPWAAGTSHDYVVEIGVDKFEGYLTSAGSPLIMAAHLEAHWKIFDPASNKVLKQGVTTEMVQGRAAGYSTLVSGLEQTLLKLEADLVSAVAGL
ncbi:MAG: membrane integrity-associated transporter subunit PqiC [Rhodothermales bacterium]